MFQVKIFWVVLPYSVVVGFQRFKGPCCLHLQGEVVWMGENDIDIGPDWRRATGASQDEVQSDPATSATSMRRES
jgi:hypothetical protein